MCSSPGTENSELLENIYMQRVISPEGLTDASLKTEQSSRVGKVTLQMMLGHITDTYRGTLKT